MPCPPCRYWTGTRSACRNGWRLSSSWLGRRARRRRNLCDFLYFCCLCYCYCYCFCLVFMRSIVHKQWLSWLQQIYYVTLSQQYAITNNNKYPYNNNMILNSIFIITLMAQLPAWANSTKFKLVSTPASDQLAQQLQIPLLHDHPFSCQLVFFTVYDNKFAVNVTQLPSNVSTLSIDIRMRDQWKYENSTDIKGNTSILFLFDLNDKNWTQSYQAIMDFNLSYLIIKQNEQSSINELRKAYMLFCQHGQTRYIVKLPVITLTITQAMGLIFILLMPWNIQYRKFLPFTYNILTCFIQLVILFIAYYLHIIFGANNVVFQVQRYFLGMLQLICLIIYSQDLLMLVTDNNKLAFFLGFFFSLSVMGLDYFLPQVEGAWFLNDVIAIMVAGAFIKFFIIRKLKSAIWGLALMWIFCFFREFAKQMGIQKFDSGLGIRIVPLYLQLPTYWEGDGSSLTCSAFSGGKIIAFGVILNFCKRIDLYLSTQFYRILLSISAVICIVIQLICNIFFQDRPTIQEMGILLYYPLAVFLLLFFANKRGEWAQIWHGSFYDIAVNRASIPRRISFQDMESDFGRDLMASSQITSQNEQIHVGKKQKYTNQ